jgi:acyl-CoA dehydrogenase
VKKGIVERRLDRDAITDAVAAGVLDEAEAATLRLADIATDRVIKVDDFEFDELAAKQLSRRDEEETPAGRAAE